MKFKVNKILHVECTLDGSETIMFSKGGRHQIELFKYDPNDDEKDSNLNLDDIPDFHKMIISFQMERGSQGYHEWIKSEADKHKERVKVEEKEEALRKMENETKKT